MGFCYANKSIVFMAVCLAAIVLLQPATAQEKDRYGGSGSNLITSVPRSMSYQGILKDAGGDPVTDSVYSVTFRIFNIESGGSSLWDETLPCTTSAGYFSAVFSNVNLPFDEDYWLELEVDSEILDPRQKMSMVGYAAVSDTADYAFAAPVGGGNWSVSDSVLFTDNYWGIARGGAGNVLHGDSAHSMVNLGVACTTGTSGSSYYYSTVSGGLYNSAGSQYSAVGGGLSNTASGDYSTVSGGYTNTASGDYSTVGGGYTNTASEIYTTVGGGWNHAALGEYSTVSGGAFNFATQPFSAIGGGFYNSASDTSATISGGDHNAASGKYSTVSGGYVNTASGFASMVGGGYANAASGDYSFAAGRRAKANHNGTFVWADQTDADFTSTGADQFLIRASGGVGIGKANPAEQLDVAGTAQMTGFKMPTGSSNGYILTSDASGVGTWQEAAAGSNWSVTDSVLFTNNCWGIARGGASNILYGNNAHTMINLGVACTTGTSGQNYRYSTVSGGSYNAASGDNSTVGGGENNNASDEWSTVGGGWYNTASVFSSTVSGGSYNTASSNNAAVGGGQSNTASGIFSTVSGGSENTASGFASMVGGGYANAASGDYSFAAGRRAKANHNGTFVWADQTDADFTSTGADQFLIRASGGVGIGKANPAEQLDVAGTAQMTGFKMPTGSSNGYILTSDASGVGTWQEAAAGSNWSVSDSVLFTNQYWGVARGGAGNVFYGDSAHTMVNLGVSCTTGTSGQNYSYSTVNGGWYNAGSGHISTVGGGVYNTASGTYSTVGGGWNNTASHIQATISGGEANSASGPISTVGGGSYNIANGDWSAVGGGFVNSASANYSTVGGGEENTASGAVSTVGGGTGNTASNSYSTVSGGNGNTASNSYSTVSGGTGNTASSFYSTVGGGNNNTATGNSSTVGGGGYNDAASTAATVGGGNYNTASGDYSAIGGGRLNGTIGRSSIVAGGEQSHANGQYAGVSGGFRNNAIGNYAWIGGGANNYARGQFSVVSGGGGTSAADSNSASGTASAIGGGARNTASGLVSTIGGGYNNTASDNYSTVGGGYKNSNAGDYSVIPGGYMDTLTSLADYSMAFGNQVYVNNSYRVILFDGTSHGRLGINRDDHDGVQPHLGILYPIHVGTDATNGNGAYLTDGGVWTNGSSRAFKENFQAFDSPQLLSKISSLQVDSWIFKDSDEKHIGPVAEDFVAAFDVGIIRESDGQRENRYLAAGDVAGVALAGVKELIQENRELKDLISQLERRITELENR